MGVLDTDRYFQEVFEAYAKDIFRYLYVRLNNYGVAEDLTSEVFIRFWKKIKRNMQIQNERALLYTIAHGLVVDEYRKKNRNTISVDTIDPALLIGDDRTETEIIKRDEISELYNKLTDVKDEYREVLMLYYVEEMAVIDIAKVMFKKEATIRVLIHRALNALKKLYE